MIKIKPQTQKGVRDFLPKENSKREFIISLLKRNFELFGFSSCYTPAFERLETLQGKYGEEGDKLLFKILNSGAYITESSQSMISQDIIPYSALTREISSKGLRYDLTVPMARMISQHQNDISFPFKRYQIAPVWRADRPQKGRYQEFFQCDVDIVGTKSLLCEVDLIQMIDRVFDELNLKVIIKINNRKIFNGICLELSIVNESMVVSTILDKWDKIGEEKVKEELNAIIGEEKAIKLLQILSTSSLDQISISNEQITSGIDEMNFIFSHSQSKNLKFDVKLLRGIDYYTGSVLEVSSAEVEMGSLLGGGRYDNLTEIFGLKDMSGFGISFGLDRIFDVKNELNRWEEMIKTKKVIILNLEETATSLYLTLLKSLRSEQISSDIYPQHSKMDKQLIYADKQDYTHAIIVGRNELDRGEIQIKNLKERKQTIVSSDKEMIQMFLRE